MALRAFQKPAAVPIALRAFQKPCGRSNCASRVPEVPGGSSSPEGVPFALRAFQMVADGCRAVFYKLRMEEIESAASEYEKPREARKRASLA